MNSRIRVAWNKEAECFIATHPYTNVKGYSVTISKAIKDWQWWWEVPY